MRKANQSFRGACRAFTRGRTDLGTARTPPGRSRFSARGRVIDIGGSHIQMDCRGVGTPTVVFESGLGFSGSLSWTKVQDEVAEFTRACAYSRAGIIWSDEKDGPHDGEGVARDLHAALAAAGESGPFVMTGHSIGGPYITTYTKLYGDEVCGLVYVDASHPDQWDEAALGKSLEASMLMKVAKIAQGLSWTGIVRLYVAVLGSDAPNAPREALKISSAFASKSLGPVLSTYIPHVEGAISEQFWWRVSRGQGSWVASFSTSRSVSCSQAFMSFLALR
jgi:pimeloyl-ACP methyl ester carboxylesterase